MIDGDGVVDLTRVDLLNTGLVLETLPVTLDVLGGAWGIVVFIEVRLNTEMCCFLGAQGDNLASCFDVWDTIKLAR
jgi:hypothetical protein